uniref:Cytochrome C biogenesis protein transmembrane domain-containing protein n=1 Tax=Wildemania schizophylla TaxID=1134705 RepID=A0A126G1Z3_WILSC|nr:hypothetical protein [Wildemania schizophylla]AKS28509.1 hypothetical protein [Wildemania schizophylla]
MKIDLLIYNTQHLINSVTLYQLNHMNATSFSFIFIAGLFTSLSPCVLSILPVCILFISGENQKLSQANKITNLFLFCLGIISSFIALGIITTLMAKTYSKFFSGIPVISSLVIIYMGFNLLNLVPVSTLNISTKHHNGNYNIKMYLSGLGIGLAISSCTTPIFVTLLVWISSTQKIFTGLVFILVYSIGYIFPIVIGSIFSSQVFVINSFWTNLWTPFTGTLLLSTGTFSLFSNIFTRL